MPTKLWPDALRPIDQLTDDEALVEGVADALERRWPQSRRRGPGRARRPRSSAGCWCLKHLSRWSYAELVKPTEFGKLLTIQEAEHQVVTAYAVHEERPGRIRRCGSLPSTRTKRCSAARRISQRPTGALPLPRTNKRRAIAGCGASSCRARVRRRPRVGRTNDSVGSDADSGGVLAARAASAS